MEKAQDSNSTAMSQEIQEILEHAQALVDATSGDLDEKIKSARVALKARLESAKGDFSDFEDRLLEKVQAADEFIHIKPYYAIGGSLAAGLLLGWLMSRK